MSFPKRVSHPSDRLHILSRVIRIVRTLTGLEDILEVLMDHLIELLGAERGFIMLRDPNTNALRFTTARNFSKQNLYDEEYQVSRSIVYKVVQTKRPLLTSNAQQDARFQQATSIQAFGIRAVLCAPILDRSSECIGVMYVDNRIRLGAFQEEDLEFLDTFAHQAASALENARLREEQKRIRNLFERYVSPQVVEEILTRPSSELIATRRRVTVMFIDIRSFSSLAEKTPPDELLKMLNGYYSELADIIFRHRGTVLSFLGDGLLAVFGAPLPLPQQETQAVVCAQRMIERIKERAVFKVGIGIATGEAVIGDLGTPHRREYTVIGDPVNIAARLEKLTKEKCLPILMDDATWKGSGMTGGIPLGTAYLTGKQNPVELWGL